MPSKNTANTPSIEWIQHTIHFVRGERVILDADLAKLYGVTTSALNQAVKRHQDRFPEDFMFVLTRDEVASLRSQPAMSGWGGRRSLPSAFTEHGVAMTSSVLNSPDAVRMNILIVRAFVQMRRLIASNHELARKIEALEKRYAEHDQAIGVLFAEIKKLLNPPEGKPKGRIGFRRDAD